MKLGLVQYALSLKMDEDKKHELINALIDRDDWEIIPWGYMDSNKYRYVNVETRDGVFHLNNVPVGYFGKEELFEAIEILLDRIEDMKYDERMRE